MIRHAFQKIRVGDKVYWKEYRCVKSGIVTSKEPGGALVIDDSATVVYGCDVVVIERDGVFIDR